MSAQVIVPRMVTMPNTMNMVPTALCLVQKQAPDAKRNAVAIIFFSSFERAAIPAPFGPASQSKGAFL